jgi:pimeloyl-ACP methyl ester carboxylesterase
MTQSSTIAPSGEPEVEAAEGSSLFDPLSRWRYLVTPFPRAGVFYIRSWKNWFEHRGDDGVPAVFPSLLLAGHALADEAIIAGFRVMKPASPASALVRAEAEAQAALELYGDSGFLAEPSSFYPSPPAVERPTIRRDVARKVRYERMSFDSLYEPFDGEPGRDRWLSYAANRRTRAWVLRHRGEPRPWLVCVHGTSMGKASTDFMMFRARWLHEGLGLNVVFPVLPLHGPRGDDLPRYASFPGEDVMDNVHGIAQSVWDVRRVVRWAAAQDDQPVGIAGLSLGGFVTALVAGLEPDLACALLGVPAVDLIDLIDHHSTRTRDPQYLRVLDLARQVSVVVSPLSLTPQVPRERRFIYGGLADRLAHPRHQVARLWEHWGRPEVLWYKGGHLASGRSKPVGRFVRHALESSGFSG